MQECLPKSVQKKSKRQSFKRQILKEHKADPCTNMPSFLTDHIVDYCKPEILAKNSNVFRLGVKETLKI